MLPSLGLLEDRSFLALALERSTSVLRGGAIVGVFHDVDGGDVSDITACVGEVQVYVWVCNRWSVRVKWQMVGVGLPSRLLIASVLMAGMAIRVGGAPSAAPRAAWKAELPAEVPGCDGNAVQLPI